MKLNIVACPADVRAGYLNVYDRANLANGVPAGHEGAETVWVPDLGDLNQLCLPGEAEEVQVLSLDKFLVSNVGRWLDHWVSRASIGGLVALSSIDLFEVSAALLAGHLPLTTAVALLYGDGERVHYSYPLEQMCVALEDRGVQVTARCHEHMRGWAAGVRK